ncbi:EAL domain-containing protein [Alkalibacillus salilacus]|uniref:EAL domain-containing protein (Putative c-di-GMP-specific phosphodiesterase class I) n=1 Tax=Alkalibacillus salilacus TaxID=284582 RepID=A0ABT9VGP6_9BACI|nr:EAL domain-containing protein [Alkalibacillus salilacus]MDQ0160128.1 EAL domain-containing protein (putative c-di-GMP-specific phosphodiesterase class I) [Alkalibacillus salilacus]
MLCHLCGTISPLPKEGSIFVHQETNAYQQLINHPSLSSDYNEAFLQMHFQNHDHLIELLSPLIETVSETDWIRVYGHDLNEHPIHLTIQHLYHRILNPEFVELIDNEAFEAHLQPIYHLQSEELYGYESLLRIHQNIVNPGNLFQFAQNAGLHSYLDQRARRLAIQTKADRIGPGYYLFINFLPSSIYNPEFCLKHTFQTIEEFNVPKNELVFEVVETEYIDDMSHLESILTQYKQSGMRVALDDVGSGYNNLDVLNQLNTDIIKIDRGYVRDCHINKANQDFIDRAIDIADQLNLTILAEGIETEDEMKWLQARGVHLAQGFYLGKPSANIIHE